MNSPKIRFAVLDSNPKSRKQGNWGRVLTIDYSPLFFSQPSLDAEEKNILDSYERHEWKPVKNPTAEIKKLSEYAKNTLQKDKRINIRMSLKDLDQVQVIAAQEGIPYQTLISSIIHKYVSGYLFEKKRV
jgi:predicted DNA binding CopG/RHH family protein